MWNLIKKALGRFPQRPVRCTPRLYRITVEDPSAPDVIEFELPSSRRPMLEIATQVRGRYPDAAWIRIEGIADE